MKRRSFLAALFAAPAVAKATTKGSTQISARYRLSTAAGEDGYAMSARAANIGTVNAGIMRSSNGRMVIDLGAGCITVT